MTREPLIRARDVAELLDYSPATIVDWAEAGRIPHFKVGGRLRFRWSEVEAWLEEGRRGPGAGSNMTVIRDLAREAERS